MVKLDRPIGQYAIRVAASFSPQIISGYATLSYLPKRDSTDDIPPPKNPALDYAGNVLNGFTMLDSLSLEVFPPELTPPVTSNATIVLEMLRLSNISWVMNTNPFSG